MATEREFNTLDLMQARIAFIPDQWSFNRVGKALEIKNNLRKPISEGERALNPGPFPYYGPTKIQDYISSYEQDGSYTLIGEDGDHFLKYRNLPMTQLVDGKCTVNNHAHVIAGSKTVTREWFYYYFMHRDIFSFLSRQGAGRFKLNKASLERIPLLIPPLPEQRKIAIILQTWDRAIATTEKLIDAGKQQKKALMQQLLTGKKRFAGFEEEWTSGKVGDLLESLDAGVSVNSQDTCEKSAINRILKTSCVSNGIFNISEVKYVVEKAELSRLKIPLVGDSILISRMNTPALVGANAYVKDSDGSTFLPDRLWLARPKDKVVNMRWLGFWFSSEATRAKLTGLATGTSGSMKNISKPNVMQLIILVPTLKEQEKIAKCLAVTDTELQRQNNTLASLKQEKYALMQQLLTGKRRVKIDD